MEPVPLFLVFFSFVVVVVVFFFRMKGVGCSNWKSVVLKVYLSRGAYSLEYRDQSIARLLLSFLSGFPDNPLVPFVFLGGKRH